jgi:hypothetical protein
MALFDRRRHSSAEDLSTCRAAALREGAEDTFGDEWPLESYSWFSLRVPSLGSASTNSLDRSRYRDSFSSSFSSGLSVNAGS